MTFDDFKKLIKTMIIFGEELGWLDDKKQQDRENRRAILEGGNMADYWSCLKK